MVSVVKIQEIAISNYIPHPANVVAVALSPLRTDAGQTYVYLCNNDLSLQLYILLNLCLILVIFSPEVVLLTISWSHRGGYVVCNMTLSLSSSFFFLQICRAVIEQSESGK